jgi:FdhE protein
LTPQLADIAETPALRLRHDAARVWEHGHCPYCGSLPYMGELTGRDGQRWHVCSYCCARDRAARLQCPYCGERDENKLRMFSADALPFFEVQVCTACTGYIKLADLRQKSEHLPAALNDLASLPLDMLACREGYTRPTLSAWGF